MANLPVPTFDPATGRLPDVVMAAIGSILGSGSTRAPRGDGVTDQRAQLQQGITSAATFGATYALNGDHAVSGLLNIPTGANIDMSQGRLVQLASRSVTVLLDGVSNVRLTGGGTGGIVGRMQDYVNSSLVYASTAVSIKGAARNVVLSDLTITGPNGVNIADTASDIKLVGCRIFGPGATAITSTDHNYGAGVSATNAGTWTVEDCLIANFAQGIVTGEGYSDCRIVKNVIRDIHGQHGLYLETARRGVVYGNIITATGLCGMKMQMATDAAGDSSDFVIANNVLTRVGAQGILLTNTLTNPVNRVRRFIITGNVVTTSGGPGIHCIYAASLIVSNNIVTDVTSAGLTFDRCSGITVEANRVDGCGDQGIFLANTTQFRLLFNDVLNPAAKGVATTEFGIQIGVSTSEGEIVGNRVLDSVGKMRYGLYIIGDTTTMKVKETTTVGARDAGYRGTGAVIRAWAGNSFNAGSVGTTVSPPSNVVVLTDTNGGTLTSLEADLNKLKAVLRDAGLSR